MYHITTPRGYSTSIKWLESAFNAFRGLAYLDVIDPNGCKFRMRPKNA